MQQACRLGDPSIRISPDRSAVFTDDEIEGRVPQGNLLAGSAHERKPQPELVLALSRDAQLPRGGIDTYGQRAQAREPGGDVPCAAPELHHLRAVEMRRQYPGDALGDAEDAPGWLGRRPLALGQLQLIVVARLPSLGVGPDVVQRAA